MWRGYATVLGTSGAEEGVGVGVKRSAATVGRETGRTGRPAAVRSGGVDAELDVACGFGVECGVGDTAVAKALQQAFGDFPEAAEEGDRALEPSIDRVRIPCVIR